LILPKDKYPCGRISRRQLEAKATGYAAEYDVKTSDGPLNARIFKSGKEVAELTRRGGLDHLREVEGGCRWVFSRKVHGETRPFSISATPERGDDGRSESHGGSLTVRDHLFYHNGAVYMLANAPEGRPLREFLLGRRYISRLDNFPFPELSDLDHETRSGLRRFRGVQVGEMDGLGSSGHRVRLSEELSDIGLLLSAACFLLYSSA